MGCLAEMTVAHPTSGSFGAWAEFYIGPLAGFLVRYAYWSCMVFAVGTEVTAIAVYMRYWFPMVPGWIWIVGFSAILITVECVQRKSVRRRGIRLLHLKVTAIVVFILLGGWLLRGHRIFQLHCARRVLSQGPMGHVDGGGGLASSAT